MKVVLDTNVLMSGIFWSGVPAKILQAWEQGTIQLVVIPEILDEYSRVAHILAERHPHIDITPMMRLIVVHVEPRACLTRPR